MKTRKIKYSEVLYLSYNGSEAKKKGAYEDYEYQVIIEHENYPLEYTILMNPGIKIHFKYKKDAFKKWKYPQKDMLNKLISSFYSESDFFILDESDCEFVNITKI